jgi:hypothetical protein
VLEVVEDPLPALLLVRGARAGAGGLRRHGSGWLLRSVSAERGPRRSQGRVKPSSSGERERPTERVSNFERLKRAPLLLRRGRRRQNWEKRIRRVYGAATATVAFLGGCQVGPLLCF